MKFMRETIIPENIIEILEEIDKDFPQNYFEYDSPLNKEKKCE